MSRPAVTFVAPSCLFEHVENMPALFLERHGWGHDWRRLEAIRQRPAKCRSIGQPLDDAVRRGGTRPDRGEVIERRRREPSTLAAIGRRCHLSQREIETVQHRIQGLTTKEAAQRMNMSPNTVKQFVRLVMGKLGATPRSGITGKFVMVVDVPPVVHLSP